MSKQSTVYAPDEIMPLATLKLYLRVTLENRFYAWASLLMPLGVVLFSVAVPFFASKVLAGIAQQSTNLTNDLIWLGTSSLAGMLCNRYGFYAACRMQAQTMSRLNEMALRQLLNRSVGFHANRVSGKLVSDALDFVGAYGDLANATLTSGLPLLASIFVGLTIVTLVSWPLGLFLMMVVGVTLTWAYLSSRRRATLRHRRLVVTKRVTAHLADNIVNAQTVKTFGQEKSELKHNHTLSKKLEDLRIRDWKMMGRSGSNRMGTLLLMQFAMIFLIIHLTRNDPSTLSAGIFALTYTSMLTSRLFDINALLRIFDDGLLRAAPMSAVLREDVEIEDASNAAALDVTNAAVDLQNVRFAYDENKNDAIFSGLNLSIRPGEKIGLVGPSGGGKSTLTRLLLRFDDIQDGTIAIDGQDIAKVTQNSLRKSIAYVPQEPLLFHRTVAENISYGRPDASREDIIEAARKAEADTFITNLTDGYDTVVGERGVKLSGGQRQRIAIARAILKDAPILILDEATSALDSESEVLIQKALWELMKGRTAIVIAHRLSTIQKMDRIIVLDQGTIVEEGTHKQLLTNKGLYAKLWSHQSGGFIEE